MSLGNKLLPQRLLYFLVFFCLMSMLLLLFSACSDFSIPGNFDLDKVRQDYQRRINNAITHSELNKAGELLHEYDREINFFIKFRWRKFGLAPPKKIKKACETKEKLWKRLEILRQRQKVNQILHQVDNLLKYNKIDQAKSLIIFALMKLDLDESEETKLINKKAQIEKLPSLPPPIVVGLDFSFIPTGKYRCGTPLHESSRTSNAVMELRPEEYDMEEFYISTTEVTQETYTYYLPNAEAEYRDKRCPIHSINFSDARGFCRIISEQDPKFNYSLPNEIEWEIACRSGEGPDKGPFNSSSIKDQALFRASPIKAEQALMRYAIFERNREFGAKPGIVTQKKPNAWEIYDMHGNVAEWCERVSEYQYFGHDGKQPIRGGSFLSCYARCRAGARSMEPQDTKKPTIGFRIIARPIRIPGNVK